MQQALVPGRLRWARRVRRRTRLPIYWPSHTYVYTASGLEAGLMASPLRM